MDTSETDQQNTPKADIVVDLSGWRMKDYVKWQKVVATGDFSSMNEVMATIVKAWPYAGAGDPSNVVSFGELTADEWKETAKAIGAASAAAFR